MTTHTPRTRRSVRGNSIIVKRQRRLPRAVPIITSFEEVDKKNDYSPLINLLSNVIFSLTTIAVLLWVFPSMLAKANHEIEKYRNRRVSSEKSALYHPSRIAAALHAPQKWPAREVGSYQAPSAPAIRETPVGFQPGLANPSKRARSNPIYLPESISNEIFSKPVSSENAVEAFFSEYRAEKFESDAASPRNAIKVVGVACSSPEKCSVIIGDTIYGKGDVFGNKTIEEISVRRIIMKDLAPPFKLYYLNI